MKRPMYISPVLNLDRLLLTLDQPPKLHLDVVFRDDLLPNLLRDPVVLKSGVPLALDRMSVEPVLSEGGISFLERGDAVILSLERAKRDANCQLPLLVFSFARAREEKRTSSNPYSFPVPKRQAEQYQDSFLGTAGRGGSRQ